MIWVILMFAGGLLMVAMIVCLAFVLEGKRRKRLAAWAQANGWSFEPKAQSDLTQRFAWYPAFQKGSGRHAYNVVGGDWKGHTFWAIDHHFETRTGGRIGSRSGASRTQGGGVGGGHSGGRGSNKRHVNFSVTVVDAGMPLQTVVVRPHGLVDSLVGMLGREEASVDSDAFNQRFEIEASDAGWAKTLLDDAMVEKLLAAPAKGSLAFGNQQLIWRQGQKRLSPGEHEAALAWLASVVDTLAGNPLLVEASKRANDQGGEQTSGQTKQQGANDAW